MVQKYIKILVIVLFASCNQESLQFSNVPALKLEKSPVQYQRNGKDSSVVIEVNYTDGDGDIGLEPADTLAPFNYGSKFFYNLYIDVYQVIDGKASLIPIQGSVPADSVRFNDRITNLTPTGKSKSIYGVIKINLNAVPYPGVFPDSMFYTVQIADRSLNRSNIIKTPVMKFQF